MTFEEVQLLLDYHYWARDRVCAAVEALTAEQFTRDLGNSFPSVRDTLAHLYGADWIWCSRWEGTSPAEMPDPAAFQDLASIRTAWSEQERQIRAFVARLGAAGIATALAYERNGIRQAQPFWQMFQHLVNHGSYHRGQIVTMLRQLGAKPPTSLDLIAFYRERAGVQV